MSNNINWDELPLTLRPKDMQQITGMSEKKMCEFLKDPPFHINRIGRGIFVSKNVFRKWFEGSNSVTEYKAGVSTTNAATTVNDSIDVIQNQNYTIIYVPSSRKKEKKQIIDLINSFE